jgi:hypothetical protein
MLMLRSTWVSVQILVLGVFFVLYQRIMAAKDAPSAKAKLSVPKKPSLSDPQPQGADEMTVHQYDVSQLKEAVQQVAVQLVLIAVIHYYWQATMPLITTSIMSLQRVWENKLVKIYFLGSSGPDLVRPFKPDENPFAALMPKPETTAPATAAAAPIANANNNSNNNNASKKGNATVKKQQ